MKACAKVLIGLAAMTFALAAAPNTYADYHPPLSSQLDTSQFPQDAIQPEADGGPPIEERLRVKTFLYQEIKNPAGKDIGATMTLDLAVVQGFVLKIPGLEEVLKIVFGEGDLRTELKLREEPSEDPAENFPFMLTILPADKQVAIEFAADVLKPVQPGNYQPYTSSAPEPRIEVAAGLRIQVTYSWEGEPDIQLLDAGGLRPKLGLNTPVEIGDTGIVLEIEDAEIDLSRSSSAGGLPPTWVGVRFAKLAINFVNGLDVPRVEAGEGASPPPPQMAGITATEFSIGSGGVSGSICGNLSAGPTLPLFDSDFQLERLCVTLVEGSMTAGEVGGVLSEFPFFKAENVRLTLALSLDGTFKVALSPPDPTTPGTLIDLSIPSVLVYHLQALSIEKKQDEYVWKSSGTLNINAISTAPDDAIKVDGLSITSSGDVVLDGGWLTLPGKKKIQFEGYNVELAEIGFGREDSGGTTKSWVGFTGGVELVGELGASAKFKKLQYLWMEGGGGSDVRLQGVEIAFRKPGAIAFKGALDFFDDPATGDQGFAGAVEVNIEAIKLGVQGRLVVGQAEPPVGASFPFFFVDLAASLPTGIPIFSNVSLYGITGLFSYQMMPNIVAFTTPVQWFHAHLAATNVLAGAPPPWRTQLDALAFGAGGIFGTTSDDGFVVNAKLAVMISLPGPVVMLNGAANIVKERGQLVDTASVPNFTALAIFDGSLNTFLINIGAYYSVVDLIEVQGEAEAFFNLSNPNDWHLWLGKDQPEERRIRAEVLSFFKANTYLMIDPSSTKQGASAGYEGRWKFGPLRVVLVAMFGYDISLFYRPIHVWGQVGVGGEFELSAFGIGIGLAANATLDGQTPHPFELEGIFHVKIKLPWPLPDPEATVKLRWEEDRPKLPVSEFVSALAVEPRKGGPNIWPDTISLSGDTARGSPPPAVGLSELCSPGTSIPIGDLQDIRCSKPLVPLDVLAVAAFQREANDINNLGFGNPYNSAAPKRDEIGDTHFQYDLNAFELVQAEKNGATLNFDIPLTDLYGAWPAIAGGVDPAALYLRILSRNPVDIYKYSHYLFYENGTKGWTEWAIDQYSPYYCFDYRRDPYGQQKILSATGTHGWKCPVPPGLLSGLDFILPPYSAFRLTVDTDVARDTSGPDRIYRNYVIFHTEGPPLALDPYVEVTIPASDRRPHYRGYDVGLRFNEAYMDLLYRREGQLFQVQVLDDNDQPVRSADADLIIHTEWDEAATHVPRATEDDWLQFLREHGVPVDAMVPKDDRVFGRISLPDALRGGERYKVRVWFEDERLATDTRLADSAWLQTNPVRFHTGNRAVVYEFPLLTSRFTTFDELIQSYPGNYVDLPVAAFSAAQIATLAATAAAPVSAFPPTLDNTHGTELGHYLRHALSPSGPEDVPWPRVEEWLRRAPGYNDKPQRMTDDQRRVLTDNWNGALGAYEAIDAALGADTVRQPLPERLEVHPLKHAGETTGFLVEAPESLDFTRISLGVWSAGLGIVRPTIIPNRDNTRFFIFRSSSGSTQPWPDDVYSIFFVFDRVVSDRYPVLRRADTAGYELSVIVINLPGDRFVAEAP
jgi:hypothetical protein